VGVALRTVRAWDRGRVRVPWSVVRLLRLLRCGDLEGISTPWAGWLLRGDRLISPEGREFRVRNWNRGRSRVSKVVIRLLRLRRNGELGDLEPAWRMARKRSLAMRRGSSASGIGAGEIRQQCERCGFAARRRDQCRDTSRLGSGIAGRRPGSRPDRSTWRHALMDRRAHRGIGVKGKSTEDRAGK
jgi:hypothetical protein